MGLLLGAVVARWHCPPSSAPRLDVTAGYVVLSIFVSSAVGIISGWYPARRAARLDPVAALRAE